jgi:DNA-binding transcriptional LysR family regulator
MGARLDLDDMTIFAKLVETGSFREAARALGMPASTVSRRIAALEEALGARLVERTTRRGPR